MIKFENILFPLAFFLLANVAKIKAQTTQNFDGSGGNALTSLKWSTNNAGSCITGSNSFTAGNTAVFCTPNGTGSGAVGITVGGIIATENYTHSSPTGTLLTGGTIANVNVSANKSFNIGTAAISTAAGTGFVKNGDGAFQMAGGTYAGGFTINAGTMLLGGVNAMGSGGLLTINGGVIAGTATRDLTGKYSSGITIGGDFQLGEMNTVWANANNTANLTFSNNVSLGSALRTITLGNGGTMILGGIISNSGSGGIAFTANNNGTGRFEITNTANTFTGPINILGNGTGVAEVRFSADGSLGNTSNTININGGRLATSSGATYSLTSTRGIQVGNTAGTSISTPGTGTLSYDGVIADLIGSTPGSWAKQGGGTLILGGVSNYTGSTSINNGILKLDLGNNRLPVTTLLNLGQAASSNLGTFDLNGRDQTVAGLSSTAGTNATATKNTITSSTAATLTINSNINTTYSAGTAANSGVISGAITIIKSGSGTQTFGETNSYTGKTTINGGFIASTGESVYGTNPASFVADQITLNGGGIQATSNLAFNSNRGITLGSNGGTFDAGTGVTLTALNVITGSGNLTKTGPGIMDMTGQHTYTGLTTITGGTLQLSNSSGSLPSTNSVVVNGGTLKVSANQTLSKLKLISGSVVLDLGTILTITDTLTLINCSFSGAGVIAFGTSGTLVYQGTTLQTISVYEFPSSSGPASLIIDNANGVNLPASFNRTITGVLTLTNGKLSTQSSSVLTLGSSATVSGGSSSSFVNGPMAKIGNTDFVFPIGKGTTYARAAISSLSTTTTFTAEYFANGHPDSLNLGTSLTGGRVSSIEYWDLSPSGAVTANVRLYWENNLQQGINSTSATDLVVAHYTSSNWISEGNSATAGSTSGYVTSNAVSTWSPFTFGSPSKANPLPVTLINFGAKRVSENVHLFWSTASEQNADVFLVQRFQKENGFTTIGSLKAAGNSYQILHYQFIDHAAGTGENCYRLAQLDFDGAEHFSKTVCLSGSSSPKIMIFPNPVNADLNIMSSDELIGKAILFDAAGKEHEVELVKGYGNNWKANISQLPKGVYFLKVEDDIHPMYQRIIKL